MDREVERVSLGIPGITEIDVQEVIRTHGERIPCIMPDGTMSKVFARTLFYSPLLRKCTRYTDSSTVVMDMRDSFVQPAYENVLASIFPIADVMERMYEYLEVNTHEELFVLTMAKIDVCVKRMRKTVAYYSMKAPAVTSNYSPDENNDEVMSMMKKISRRVHTFSPQYFIGEDNPDVEHVGQFIKVFATYGRRISDSFIGKLLSLPSLMPVAKDVIRHCMDNEFPTGSNIGPLVYYEYHHLLGHPITLDSSFVYQVNDPLIRLTTATDHELRNLLSIIAGIWILDEDLDMSKSCISGSMACAVMSTIIGVFRFSSTDPALVEQRMRELIKLYPSTYTVLKSYKEYLLCDNEENRNEVTHQLESINKGIISHIVVDHESSGTLIVNTKDRHCIPLDIQPGADIDIPILSRDGDEIRKIALSHFTVIKKYWSNCKLVELTDGRVTKMYRVVSPLIRDYMNGFRNVEMYSAFRSDAPANFTGIEGIVSYHLPCVRCWFGGKDFKLYATASCITRSDKFRGSVDDYHYFAGSKTPESVLMKYSQRECCNQYQYGDYNITDPVWEALNLSPWGYEGKKRSSVIFWGNFNILNHLYPRKIVLASFPKMYEYRSYNEERGVEKRELSDDEPITNVDIIDESTLTTKDVQ